MTQPAPTKGKGKGKGKSSKSSKGSKGKGGKGSKGKSSSKGSKGKGKSSSKGSTSAPTIFCSEAPSDQPTSLPTAAPSEEPTLSMNPSSAPTEEPTLSSNPSAAPSEEPTAAPSDEPTLSAQPSQAPSNNKKLVFVTSGVYDGHLVSRANAALGTSFTNAQGPEAGDALCQAEADAAGLGGSFKAWLSTTTSNAVDRLNLITNSRAFDLESGAEIAGASAASANLLDGTLDVPINVDPNGNTPVDGELRVWTGTSTSGIFIGSDCNGWSSNNMGDTGRRGRWDVTTQTWTANVDDTCDNTVRLYCFQD